jgi:2-keto-3-deoxy-L-fuconate dehydrogenase
MRLRDKVCLITNCGDLQGPPDAAEFQREGASIVLQAVDFARGEPELLKQGVELSRDRVQVIEADFGQPGVADRHISQLVAERGHLDVLVNNNAPKHLGKPLHEIDDDEWEQMFHAIVTELFYTTKAALKHMIPARRGKIVNIASSGGLEPYQGPFTAYSAARGAVVILTKALGREVAPYNIQVNAIAQNWVENPSYFPEEKITKPGYLEKLKTVVPLGRLAKPWEQARLAVFLASDDADFLCGTVIPFTGGGP